LFGDGASGKLAIPWARMQCVNFTASAWKRSIWAWLGADAELFGVPDPPQADISRAPPIATIATRRA
jgi:hypothetical protein